MGSFCQKVIFLLVLTVLFSVYFKALALVCFCFLVPTEKLLGSWDAKVAETYAFEQF